MRQLAKVSLLRLIDEHLSDKKQRQVYALWLCGDDARSIASGLSTLGLAKHLPMSQPTVWRHLKAAHAIMEPVLNAAYKRGDTLTLKGQSPAESRLKYQDELTQGAQVWDKTDITEYCAMEGVDPEICLTQRFGG